MVVLWYLESVVLHGCEIWTVGKDDKWQMIKKNMIQKINEG